jgi:hypothetical protein
MGLKVGVALADYLDLLITVDYNRLEKQKTRRRGEKDK